MSGNYTEVVVLCEDHQQWVFIRRFLIRNGVNPRRIRLRSYPGGRGAGEQFVREEYSKEVATYRSRSANLHIALIVMQDCDTKTEQERLAELSFLRVFLFHCKPLVQKSEEYFQQNVVLT
jgi:hypothetical protein